MGHTVQDGTGRKPGNAPMGGSLAFVWPLLLDEAFRAGYRPALLRFLFGNGDHRRSRGARLFSGLSYPARRQGLSPCGENPQLQLMGIASLTHPTALPLSINHSESRVCADRS